MSNSHCIDEQELLLSLKQGSEAAFSALYDRYAPRIASKLIRILKDRDLAHDLVQDVFVKVWEVRGKIDPDRSFPSYLNAIAINLSSNAFRKSLREQYMRSQLAGDCGYNHVDEAIAIKDQQRLLDQALSKLPRKQRQAYVLHKLEGKSHQQISDELGITLSAVNQHIHRASKSIRLALRPELGILLTTISSSL